MVNGMWLYKRYSGLSYGLYVYLVFCCLRWSIPLKQLVKLSGYDDRHRRWSYEPIKFNSVGEPVADGWLILEAF
jgi:hypothetical protein